MSNFFKSWWGSGVQNVQWTFVLHRPERSVDQRPTVFYAPSVFLKWNTRQSVGKLFTSEKSFPNIFLCDYSNFLILLITSIAKTIVFALFISIIVVYLVLLLLFLFPLVIPALLLFSLALQPPYPYH